MALKDRLLDPISTSVLGLGGNKGPEFENEGQMFTSPIQAYTGLPPTNELKLSEDLVSGRFSRQIPLYPYFKAPSKPPVSFPDGREGQFAPWGPYSRKYAGGVGPVEGRY
jgi:hypothetical protein